MRALLQVVVVLVALGLILTGLWWVWPPVSLITGGVFLLVALYIEAYLNSQSPMTGTR